MFSFRIDKRKISEELRTSERSPILKKHHSDIYLNDNDLSSLNNRNASKVTFESFVTQNSISSSPKTKDQCVMVQIDIKEELVYANHYHEQAQNGNETKNTQTSLGNEATTGTNSTKSSLKELLQSKKSSSRRKSKSQNRARKALRTITFILGMFSTHQGEKVPHLSTMKTRIVYWMKQYDQREHKSSLMKHPS